MRIIGKTRDYYDGVIAYGIDPNCIYIRKREEVKFEDIGFDIESLLYPRHFFSENTFITYCGGTSLVGLSWSLYIIGFCGKLYPCIKLSYKENVEYIYDISLVPIFLEQHKLKQELKEYNSTRQWHHFTKHTFNIFFDFIEGINSECDELFFERKIPVFVINIDKKGFVWNEILKDYQFYKVKDPFTAFQDLSGYVSGVLGGQSPMMIEISNEDMIHKRGFDNMSFKKEPSKKKK